MSKAVKSAMIDEIKRRIGEARDFLLVDSSKLDANTNNVWRSELRKKGIHAFVVKNSLVRRALHDSEIESLDPYLSGPSTLVWGGEDVVALAKELTKWEKELEPLEIKGGTVDGSESLDSEGVKKLSKSPGREELLSMISGALLGPGGTVAAAMLGPGSTVVGAIKAKGDEEGDDAE